MPGIKVRVEPHHAGIADFMRTDIARAMLRVGLQVETRAKTLCPVDSGYLRSSINTRLAVEKAVPVVYVGSHVEYALWVHEGTGIYGPRHTPIRPIHGKYLVFKPKGSTRTVYAKQVRGMRGRPFLAQALRDVLGGGTTP
jgi:hypothetical protein